MDFKKIIKIGLIIGLCIVLISLVGMGVLDIMVLIVIGLLLIIAAGISTLVHNQRIDKE